MRPAIILVVVLAIIPILGNASTEAGAFTRSYLICNESNSSAIRTFSQNSFLFMPGLYINGYGEADIKVKSEDLGLMILDQTINFSNDNSQYSGIVTSHVLGRNLTELNVSISAVTSTGLSKEENLSLIRSQSTGLGLADPGNGSYEFYLTGGHYLILDSSDIPLVYRRPLQPYEFSFQADDTALDEPADFIDQKVDLIYSVSPDYEQSYTGYDFSRTLQDGDITCQSNMEYGWVSDSE
ncbi:MAG: hypothetical protein JW999_11210 [Methanotrichaceae archaeon]|nr:hypothetical protein [Methanotrichaceae archaeon]